MVEDLERRPVGGEPVILDEIVATIDSFSDAFSIFARHPWTAESPADVGDVSTEGLEFFRRVSDAKEKLQHYVGDPPAMRVARVVAFADARRAERARAETAQRTFSYGHDAVGYLEQAATPSEPGRYAYMPYRGRGHLRMVEAVERDGSARCVLPSGVRFRVVAIPEPQVLVIDAIDVASDPS